VRVIIQIPCYNEEQTLPQVLADLPRAIPGVDEVETLVISDGSRDGTVRVARECGADHIVELPHNRGLAVAWSTGIEEALRLGADIIVNTDGDNQYAGADVATLVIPVLNREADIVIGARPVDAIEHFSWLKKRLQRLGSWLVGWLAGTPVPDAASGFRAYSAEAALRLTAGLRLYTHTADTIIRANRKGLTIRSVPVRVNEKLRDSRLISSMVKYLWQQALTVARTVTMAHPLRVFGAAAGICVLAGAGGCLRFLVMFFRGHGSGHVQSLLLSGVLITVGFVVGMIGLAADMISANRRLIEDVLYHLKKAEIENHRAAREAGRRQGSARP
jgi:hypothetical protein